MVALRRSALVVAAAMSLLVFGCKDTTKPVHTLTGHWVANFNDSPTGTGGIAVTLDLTLAQTGTAVSGNGTISGGGATNAVNISGTHVHPNASLTVDIPGFLAANVTGTCNDAGREIVARLNGSGFEDVPLTLVLQ